MLQREDPQVEKAQSPDEEHAEDFGPIQIGADSPEEKEERLKKLTEDLTKKFQIWESWRKPLETLWNDIYKMYFSVPDVNKTPTRAKIFIPVVFQVIEATIPKLINVIFGGDEFFDVEPSVKDNQPQARVIKLLLDYQMDQADFFEKFLDYVKQMLLYGTTYFLVTWKVKRAHVFTRTPKRYANNILGFNFGDVIEWEEKKEWKVVERRPDVEVLDILDVYPDPDARAEKDAEGIFIQSWMDEDDIKEMGAGKYPVFANTDSPALGASRDNTFGTSRQTRKSTRGVSNELSGREPQVQLLTYWGKYDLDGDGIREEVEVVLGNKKVVLKAIPNPFLHQKRPIVRSVLFPVPNEWFGLGLVEPVMPLVHELNTLRRQRLDNINQCLNRMWKVLNYADISLDTLVSSPNGIILVDSMDSLAPLEQANVTDQAYTEAAVVQQDIENTTAPKSIQGSPDSGKLGRTAKGAQLIIGQALEKFGTASRLLEETGIKRVLRMFHQLNLQFIDNDEVLRDPGLYGHLFDQKITPEMIRAEVDFKMKGISELVNRESKINQIMSFMSIFGKVLDPRTITSLAKQIWSLMGFDTKDININAVQPVPPQAGKPGQPVSPQQAAAAAAQLGNQNGPPAIPK